MGKNIFIMISIKSLFTLLFTLLSLLVTAQQPNKSGYISKKDVIELVSQYPYCFESMIGKLLSEQKQYWTYLCDTEGQTWENCKIIKYKFDSSFCSLEAVMYTTDDFNKAVTAYKTLYNSFHATSFHPMGIKMRFEGAFAKPSKKQKINRVTLRIVPGDAVIEDMRVQVSLINLHEKWQLVMLIANESKLSITSVE